MEELKLLIDRTIELVNLMTDMFYQQKNNEAMNLMNTVLDSVMAISAMLPQVETLEEAESNKLLKVLEEAVVAMENKDYVLLADILKYDMIDVLELYSNKIG